MFANCGHNRNPLSVFHFPAQIFERPYSDSILLHRGCVCNSSNQSHLPVEYTSTGRDVEVHFTAHNMTTLDDPDTANFEGMFEFVKAPTSCKDGRRKFGPSGTIDMTFGDVSVEARNEELLLLYALPSALSDRVPLETLAHRALQRQQVSLCAPQGHLPEQTQSAEDLERHTLGDEQLALRDQVPSSAHHLGG